MSLLWKAPSFGFTPTSHLSIGKKCFKRFDAVCRCFVSSPTPAVAAATAVARQSRDSCRLQGGLDPDSLTNLKLIYDVPETLGEVTDRMSLKKVQPERFSTVLILADESTRDSQMTDSDSRALATLLLVRVHAFIWRCSKGGG